MRLFIINGATRGLGYAFVQQLITQKEQNILCIVRDKSKLSDLIYVKDRIQIIKCDYSNLREPETMGGIFNEKIDMQKITEVFFMNNLSIVNPIDTICNLKTKEIKNSININITSNLIVIKEFLNFMKNHEASVYILNISSAISKSAKPGLMMYGLAKAYCDYLTASINLEKNQIANEIHSTSFYPGGIDTKMQEELQKELKKESLSEFNYDNIYNQKLLKPKEVAKMIFENFIINKKNWEEKIISINRIKK